MTKIAFLGLGAMGSRMALSLVKAGFAVTVWNRDQARTAPLGLAGARIAADPRAAADGADAVISMVTDDSAARSVWLDPERGALAGLDAGAVAVEVSTVSPAWIAELSAAVAAKGARLLDAPVAGSLPQAETGQLIFMAGGEAEALDAVRPALDAMAEKVLHVGPTGRGAMLKLAVNALFAAQLASVAELLGLLGRAGFSRGEAAALLAEFPIMAPPIAGSARMMAAGDTTPLFTIDLIEKDLGYAIGAAAALGARLPGAEATRAAFEKAQARGMGAANVSGLAAVFA